jgi:hypothetical protein
VATITVAVLLCLKIPDFPTKKAADSGLFHLTLSAASVIGGVAL